jgi:hypothetical protein
VWRIPPWQPAALIVLATVLIAIDIYGRPSPGLMLMAGFVAAAALVAAGCAVRYLLVADEDGIWVRRVFTQELVEWHDVAHIEMTTAHRNGMTVRITRVSGAYVDVPPSLLLPTLPMNMRKVRSIVHGTATYLSDLAAEQRR